MAQLTSAHTQIAIKCLVSKPIPLQKLYGKRNSYNISEQFVDKQTDTNISIYCVVCDCVSQLNGSQNSNLQICKTRLSWYLPSSGFMLLLLQIP